MSWAKPPKSTGAPVSRRWCASCCLWCPGLAVTAIFAFLASWNEFLFALLLTSVRAQTTPVVIANFQTQFGLDWGGMTALATVYSVPVILLTLFLQRHIVAGLTLGAVKG